MIAVLSPAKTLDYESALPKLDPTAPRFADEAKTLAHAAAHLTQKKLSELMHISPALAKLNADRFRDFDTLPERPAMFAFAGDVYTGLEAQTLDEAAVDYAQDHVRMLSGLYGLLRPLDLMHPYRLEMGIRLANPVGKDLYAFWGDTITDALNRQAAATGAQALVNLASEEYFKSVRTEQLDVPVITPVFEDCKNGKYRIISFFAKRARGMMARYAAVKGITDPAKLKRFDVDGYAFVKDASSEARWVFRRNQER